MITRESLLEVNKSYYKAFENFDLDTMSQIWSNTDDVICIHPGWDILVGWEKVRESWKKFYGRNFVEIYNKKSKHDYLE